MTPRIARSVVEGLLLLCAGMTARGGAIFGSSSGLASPAETITFDEILLSMDSSVTNQYSSLGVTFSPNVFYSPQTGFGNVQGNDIGNFTLGGGGPINPVTISFTSPQTAVAFSMDADTTPYLFQAFLGASPVDSFTFTVGVSSSDFFGFQGELFDSIVITQSGAGSGPFWVADNIQLGTSSAVPEPGSMVLIAPLLGVGFLLRHRFLRP